MAEVAAANATVAASMSETVGDLGLVIEGLNISLDGDIATITRRALNLSIREKIILFVGNTAGISGVNDQMEVENEEPEAHFYTVEKGGYLSKISKKIYGDAMKYNIILKANTPMLKDPDKIYPGQVLRIPHLDK
ncbi:MAG: nucleoid-associated protein YgaU [Flavobacteriales bacterium]|jgi:nucleoid-associated protein YgaU